MATRDEASATARAVQVMPLMHGRTVHATADGHSVDCQSRTCMLQHVCRSGGSAGHEHLPANASATSAHMQAHNIACRGVQRQQSCIPTTLEGPSVLARDALFPNDVTVSMITIMMPGAELPSASSRRLATVAFHTSTCIVNHSPPLLA